MARNVSWILAGFMLIALLDASLAEEGEWIQKADMPTARSVPSASVVNGIIYAIGGTPDNAAVLSTLEAYNPQTDKWTKKKDMPTARSGFSTSVVNGKVYAIGGTWGARITFSIVEAYDTGFTGQAVKAKGKLATLWGRLKAAQ